LALHGEVGEDGKIQAVFDMGYQVYRQRTPGQRNRHEQGDCQALFQQNGIKNANRDSVNRRDPEYRAQRIPLRRQPRFPGSSVGGPQSSTPGGLLSGLNRHSIKG
jgi:D-alanine-D-alanine ligase-like ATP-grasp enzyme